MRYYCQLLNLSAGYVPNSIPPRFDDALKQPKELLGSDAVSILDARNSISSMKYYSERYFNSIKKLKPSVIGFRVVRSSSFIDTDIQENKRYIVYEHIVQYIRFDEIVYCFFIAEFLTTQIKHYGYITSDTKIRIEYKTNTK